MSDISQNNSDTMEDFQILKGSAEGKKKCVWCSMRHAESARSPHTLEHPTKRVGAAYHPSAVR